MTDTMIGWPRSRTRSAGLRPLRRVSWWPNVSNYWETIGAPGPGTYKISTAVDGENHEFVKLMRV